ncbi:MAG: uncharacterized protein QOG04_1047 [Actinomycetota bacterium]|jgi:uncharacterized membrane protein (UPF0127 family)|nr:uncharacterized protein [Actinomycetota bacterium]
MKTLVASLVVIASIFTSCARADQAPGATPSQSPSFRPGTALIDTEEGSVLVRIEVADTPELQELGLMNRTSLDDDAGMLFLFFEDTTVGFWMKNTLIPLSVAFFNRDGEILSILDMEPCEADPCPSYDPGVTYRGALEVNKGAFDDWGATVGDTVRVSP